MENWQGPVLGGLVTIILGLFGFQTYKRKQSKDELSETENTVGGVYLGRILEDFERKNGELLEAKQEAAMNLDMYLAEKRHVAESEIEVMGLKYEVTVLKAQVAGLAKVVLRYRPEAFEELQNSGFASLETIPHRKEK